MAADSSAARNRPAEDSRRKDGRGERIRTSDPLHPMQVRYQAAPRPESESAESSGRLRVMRTGLPQVCCGGHRSGVRTRKGAQ